MRLALACLLLAAAADTAAAGGPTTNQRITDLLTSIASANQAPEGTRPMRFIFNREEPIVEPSYDEPGAADNSIAKNAVIAFSADKKVAWISAVLDEYSYCGDEECAHAPPDAHLHGTMVLENQGGWNPLAAHIALAVGAKDQAKALAKGVKLADIERHVDAGADDAVKLFEATIGDPKLLAASVSDRKDVVLFGSELSERYVGPAAVKAQLTRWNLVFKLRDGVQAGVSSNRTVAWVAANVDATPVKKPGAKPSPYRALFVYEKTGTAWQIVQAHFSFLAR
jgi:ketosteroid isomerase-like protein